MPLLCTSLSTWCNILQYTTTLCNTLQHMTHCNKQEHAICVERCNTLQHTATHCNTLQQTTTNKSMPSACKHAPKLSTLCVHAHTHAHARTHINVFTSNRQSLADSSGTEMSHCHTATNYNTLQQTASHSITLQHTTAHCHTMQHIVIH